MLNIVWVLLLIIGFIAGIINGRINEIAQSIMTSADDAVKFAIGLLGIVALWCGIIQILEDAGGVRAASKVLRPLITKLFPGTAGNEKAQSSIITNITANTNSTNKAYTNDAKKGMVSKIVANGNADGVNTVSGATCSSKAIKDACQKAFNAAKK